jgi:hypothetical protein
MAEQKEQPFGFPFTPYPIQVEFMRSLYDALQNKRIGIFESPTGTVRFRNIYVHYREVTALSVVTPINVCNEPDNEHHTANEHHLTH